MGLDQEKRKLEDIILYTVLQVSKILGVNKTKVYDFIKAGILPALNLGGGLKVRKITLVKFLEDYEGYDLTDVNHLHKIELAV